MDRKILLDYIDACELIKETEQDIQKLRRKKGTLVQDRVSGSMPDFPYAKQNFHLEGTQYSYMDDVRLRCESELLQKRKANAEEIKMSVEAYMNTIPVRMQRIIRWRFFEGLAWEDVAAKIGKNSTGESIKKEFQRFVNN